MSYICVHAESGTTNCKSGGVCRTTEIKHRGERDSSAHGARGSEPDRPAASALIIRSKMFRALCPPPRYTQRIGTEKWSHRALLPRATYSSSAAATQVRQLDRTPLLPSFSSRQADGPP